MDLRVALNVLRRSMRRRSRERQVLAQVGPSAPLVTALPQPEVWAAVAAPPERQRKVVVLRYVADLPEATIAEVLGMRRGTVASDLFRARAGLASTLQDTRPTPREVPHGC